MKYLLTYEDALAMVEKYENFNYSKSEFRINGYRIVTFKYFLCEYADFTTPLDKKEVNGFDMRGITFVFNLDGSLYQRFFMLPKFFNLNQVECTQYSAVKNKKIRSITEKEDGSLVAFMNLPDGTIFCKTISGFDNDQVMAATEILEANPDLKLFIKDSLLNDYTPIFEYTSYLNRIVLEYSSTDLRFLGLRDNVNGNYIPAYRAGIPNDLKMVLAKKVENYTLDELILKAKTETDKEGWVIEFEDGQMLKIKTSWYFMMHSYRDNSYRENKIIEMILNSTIDDVIAQFNEPIFTEKINSIIIVIDNYIKRKIIEIENLCKNYTGNKKDFAIKYSKDKNFSFAMQYISNEKKIKDIVISYILSRTKHLKNAREFIEKGVI